MVNFHYEYEIHTQLFYDQVSKFQAVVPELSVAHHSETRQPLGAVNRMTNHFERSVEDSLYRTLPSNTGPKPHAQPTLSNFRATEMSQ